LKKIYNNIEDKKKIWEYILCSGEDYKLLFSVSPKNKYLLKKKKIKNIKKIGFFKKGNSKEIRIFDENKNITELSSIGFSHF
jgi:thiamine monophosphate kinase